MFVAAAAAAAAAADDDDDGAAAADAAAATVAVLHSVEIFLVHISIAVVACGLSCLSISRLGLGCLGKRSKCSNYANTCAPQKIKKQKKKKNASKLLSCD